MSRRLVTLALAAVFVIACSSLTIKAKAMGHGIMAGGTQEGDPESKEFRYFTFIFEFPRDAELNC
jgi:hypothetical protein